ncbi:uncharacterized protein LOC123683977 [Harmonia axyridis]|uniref:uncharacterized protein LOC123683977 n=1 Tax=Harmonia axyridis TaxID=115357 RepID=UPI001E27549C|nr:uncharacterized protein LOC123683977 [Harmonia axyridis]
MDVDACALISLVENKPVLWDKTLDDYKLTNRRLEAWREICLILNPEFEKLDEKERKKYGKSVSDKWNNIRDTWRKSMKNKKDEKKSGSAAKKSRRYIHEEQLMFLKKVYEPRSTQESIQNCDEGNVQSGPSNATEFRKPSIPKSTKSTTDVDEKISKFLDSRMTQQKENPNLLFFKGVLPAVDSFTMDETLEFQAGVLALIQKIKGRNRVGFQRYDYQTEWQDPYRGYHTQPLQQLAAFVHSPSPTSQSSYLSQPSPAATSALQSIQQTTAFVHSPSPTSQSSYHSQPSPAATSALQSIQQTAAFVHSPSPTSQSSYHSQQSSAASSVSNYDFEEF